MPINIVVDHTESVLGSDLSSRAASFVNIENAPNSSFAISDSDEERLAEEDYGTDYYDERPRGDAVQVDNPNQGHQALSPPSDTTIEDRVREVDSDFDEAAFLAGNVKGNDTMTVSEHQPIVAEENRGRIEENEPYTPVEQKFVPEPSHAHPPRAVTLEDVEDEVFKRLSPQMKDQASASKSSEQPLLQAPEQTLFPPVERRMNESPKLISTKQTPRLAPASPWRAPLAPMPPTWTDFDSPPTKDIASDEDERFVGFSYPAPPPRKRDRPKTPKSSRRHPKHTDSASPTRLYAMYGDPTVFQVPNDSERSLPQQVQRIDESPKGTSGVGSSPIRSATFNLKEKSKKHESSRLRHSESAGEDFSPQRRNSRAMTKVVARSPSPSPVRPATPKPREIHKNQVFVHARVRTPEPLIDLEESPLSKPLQRNPGSFFFPESENKESEHTGKVLPYVPPKSHREALYRWAGDNYPRLPGEPPVLVASKVDASSQSRPPRRRSTEKVVSVDAQPVNDRSNVRMAPYANPPPLPPTASLNPGNYYDLEIEMVQQLLGKVRNEDVTLEDDKSRGERILILEERLRDLHSQRAANIRASAIHNAGGQWGQPSWPRSHPPPVQLHPQAPFYPQNPTYGRAHGPPFYYGPPNPSVAPASYNGYFPTPPGYRGVAPIPTQPWNMPPATGIGASTDPAYPVIPPEVGYGSGTGFPPPPGISRPPPGMPPPPPGQPDVHIEAELHRRRTAAQAAQAAEHRARQEQLWRQHQMRMEEARRREMAEPGPPKRKGINIVHVIDHEDSYASSTDSESDDLYIPARPAPSSHSSSEDEATQLLKLPAKQRPGRKVEPADSFRKNPPSTQPSNSKKTKKKENPPQSGPPELAQTFDPPSRRSTIRPESSASNKKFVVTAPVASSSSNSKPQSQKSTTGLKRLEPIDPSDQPIVRFKSPVLESTPEILSAPLRHSINKDSAQSYITGKSNNATKSSLKPAPSQEPIITLEPEPEADTVELTEEKPVGLGLGKGDKFSASKTNVSSATTHPANAEPELKKLSKRPTWMSMDGVASALVKPSKTTSSAGPSDSQSSMSRYFSRRPDWKISQEMRKAVRKLIWENLPDGEKERNIDGYCRYVQDELEGLGVKVTHPHDLHHNQGRGMFHLDGLTSLFCRDLRDVLRHWSAGRPVDYGHLPDMADESSMPLYQHLSYENPGLCVTAMRQRFIAIAFCWQKLQGYLDPILPLKIPKQDLELRMTPLTDRQRYPHGYLLRSSLLPSQSDFKHPDCPLPKDFVFRPKTYNIGSIMNLSGLKLRWTDRIEEHLVLDDRMGTVSLFRFACLCVVNKHIPGVSAASAHLYYNSKFPCSNTSTPYEYTWEILLTYNLLFSTPASQKIFRDEYKENALDDEYLLEACTQKTTKAFQQTGYPITDFPFFAERLCLLDNFFKQAKPGTLRQLFWDSRDTLQWYTFIIGMAVFTLTIVGLILGVLQTVASYLALKPHN